MHKHNVMSILMASMIGFISACDDSTDPIETAVPSGDPVQTPKVDDKIPGQYIVVLRDDILAEENVEHISESYGLELQHTYNYVLNGFAATIPADRLNTVLADPRVAFVS